MYLTFLPTQGINEIPEKGRLEIVTGNLEYIEKLLDHPDRENFNHTWDDFK
jgi:hypothetical protein